MADTFFAIRVEKAQWLAAKHHRRGADDQMNSPLLPPGTQAPDFSLSTSPGERVSLRDFLGKPVVLAFYPADWSPVCGDQMTLYSALREEFDRLGAVVLGISVDGPWCHLAFTKARNLRLTLLADFEPKGEVSRTYHAYNEQEGTSTRALFVIDVEGVIRWSYLSPDEVNPGADGILDALERLSTPIHSEGR
jgi:peroxiredoxin